MQDDCKRVHELHFKLLGRHLLAHGQVVAVDQIDGNVDSLTCLLELHAHLVYAIDNFLPAF